MDEEEAEKAGFVAGSASAVGLRSQTGKPGTSELEGFGSWRMIW